MISPTQLASYKQIQKDIPNRKAEILYALSILGEATAREIKDFLGYTDGNAIKPRLTELLREYPCRIKELHNPKWDEQTERFVKVFKLRNETKDGQLKMWG